MMEFGLKDLIYIVGIVASALISFLGTRYGLREYIRDNTEKLKDNIHDLELQLNRQQARDDLQQQVIDQIGEQMKTLIPRLFQIIQDRQQKK